MSEALQYIKKHPDYTSYYLLIAIRRYYPNDYKNISNPDKAAILCSALNNSCELNDWEALLETKQDALKPLLLLLDNTNVAPLFGSKQATRSSIYSYRRNDFAFRYVCLIVGQTPPFYADPRTRDEAINALKAKLKEKAK
jgi:hypothetical protein